MASQNQAPENFVASIGFDRRLYREDIAGSIAHARMLARQGIISQKEAELIIMGLTSIRGEIERGEFPFSPGREDIHMNIEARLHEKIGDAAGKLHTARSRNDQVATDMRLYTKKAIAQALSGLRDFQKALLDLAQKNRGVIFPGYTHLRPAQPVLFSHYLLAYFEMAQRDKGRFRDCLRRADVLPLGAGALAGVPYPIDPASVAQELGFATTFANSVDAVSDRDFLLEYQSAAAITMMHLSRLSEELILWSSPALGLVEIAPAYTTGSSIMPQKRNPDGAELVRGKTGRVYGHLLGLLTVMKGLPLAYNRDMQEDKEGFFDTMDTLMACLGVMAGMVASLKVDPAAARRAAGAEYSLATDVADYLVKKGMPFRQAHQVVARLVSYALSLGKGLEGLTLEEYRTFSPLFEEAVRSITLESSVASRTSPGGTAPQEVEKALEQARRQLAEETESPLPNM